MKWSFVAQIERAGQQAQASDEKIFFQIAPGWAAQITARPRAQRSPIDDALALHVLEGIKTTSDPDCYWPFIRRVFPGIH